MKAREQDALLVWSHKKKYQKSKSAKTMLDAPFDDGLLGLGHIQDSRAVLCFRAVILTRIAVWDGPARSPGTKSIYRR